MNCLENIDDIYILEENFHFYNENEEFVTPEKIMIKKIMSKDPSLKFKFCVYRTTFQKNYDDEEIGPELTDAFIQCFDSLDDVKQTNPKNCIIKKICFYQTEKNYDLYKNDSTLKLSELFAYEIVLKQWIIK